MKWNKYNCFFENGNAQFVLYNCATTKLMVGEHKLKQLICDNLYELSSLNKIHPDLYSFLYAKQFIIDDGVDETAVVIKNIMDRSISQEYFGLTINPTLDCNLRCWYCYETHQINSVMDIDTIESVKNLIKNKLNAPEMRVFELSFFGGEPLLKFNSVVIPIILYTNTICKQQGVKLKLGFTSNGVLLTRRISDFLAQIDVDTSFQIAFDGNREFHNKTKKHSNGYGTYDKVINNIRYALSKGHGFNIRCNYSPENIHSFHSLLDQFDEYVTVENQLSFSLHKIWQTTYNQDTLDTLNELEDFIAAKNMNISNSFEYLFSPCYADTENNIVVNYNGDVFNCTARDFTTENSEGVLNSDGTITYNHKHLMRMNSRFSIKECLDCIIFPICDVCTQKKTGDRG